MATSVACAPVTSKVPGDCVAAPDASLDCGELVGHEPAGVVECAAVPLAVQAASNTVLIIALTTSEPRSGGRTIPVCGRRIRLSIGGRIEALATGFAMTELVSARSDEKSPSLAGNFGAFGAEDDDRAS